MKASGILGQIIGIVVFVVGIAMLVHVFLIGWQVFQSPDMAPKNPDPGGDAVVTRLATLVVRLAFLLVMSIAGSLVASKGIQLYAAESSSGQTQRKTFRTASPPDTHAE